MEMAEAHSGLILSEEFVGPDDSGHQVLGITSLATCIFGSYFSWLTKASQKVMCG